MIDPVDHALAHDAFSLFRSITIPVSGSIFPLTLTWIKRSCAVPRWVVALVVLRRFHPPRTGYAAVRRGKVRRAVTIIGEV